VTLIDANILLYAANRSAPEHPTAREWLDRQLSGTVRVGLPWPSLLAFVRLATNPLVLSRPASIAQAWGQVEEWLGADVAWVPTPGERHRTVMAGYCQSSWMTSRLVPDAHLAALAVEHGLRLCSSDADFARFPGVDWFNPLAV
jgi:uncharacterized protein